MRRALSILTSFVLAVGVALAASGVYVVRRAFPQVSGTVRVEGLGQPVEVVRDRWGIPHIYARNELDLFFAQGYVHAQDRLWQMEMYRRTAAGRLSEVFGERTLSTDRFLRTLGLRHAAELEWDLLLMAYELGGNWQTELLRAELERRLGPQAAARLLPGELPGSPVIVPGPPPARAGSAGAMLGSNNWVLSGRLTDTGRPYLANDPHLRAGFPSIWYANHLEGGRYRVTGFTFPGVPGVVVGHNGAIAWGVTNANPDVQDLFVERFHPQDPSRYLFRGRWLPVRTRVEEIRVRGRRQPVRWVVRSTHHGPILNGAVEGLREVVALRWTALLPTTVAEGILRLNRARCAGLDCHRQQPHRPRGFPLPPG